MTFCLFLGSAPPNPYGTELLKFYNSPLVGLGRQKAGYGRDWIHAFLLPEFRLIFSNHLSIQHVYLASESSHLITVVFAFVDSVFRASAM